MTAERREGEDREEIIPIIRKTPGPARHNDDADAAAWNRFTRGLRGFWDHYIRGYAWGQVDRLREAKLREIESANDLRYAEAHTRLAEARKLDAEAELAFVQADIARRGAASAMLDLLRDLGVASTSEPTDDDWERLRRTAQVILNAGATIDIAVKEQENVEEQEKVEKQEK